MRQINKLKSFFTGEAPTHLANDGNPVDVITIKYKDAYLFVDIDEESGSPTGGFGWSNDPTMNPTKPIREILIAKEQG